MESDIKDQIQKDISENKIVIYMKGTPDMPQCGFSKAVVDAFQELGVEFQTRDVLSDPQLRQGIKAFTNWPTIPQVYINGEFVGGCDITLEMYKSGELKKMVGSF